MASEFVRLLHSLLLLSSPWGNLGICSANRSKHLKVSMSPHPQGQRAVEFRPARKHPKLQAIYWTISVTNMRMTGYILPTLSAMEPVLFFFFFLKNVPILHNYLNIVENIYVPLARFWSHTELIFTSSWCHPQASSWGTTSKSGLYLQGFSASVWSASFILDFYYFELLPQCPEQWTLTLLLWPNGHTELTQYVNNWG